MYFGKVNSLFKRFDIVDIKYVPQIQAYHKMQWLLFQQGVYWLTMLNDYTEIAKGCQECQKHAGIQYIPARELHLIIKPWSFGG